MTHLDPKKLIPPSEFPLTEEAKIIYGDQMYIHCGHIDSLGKIPCFNCGQQDHPVSKKFVDDVKSATKLVNGQVGIDAAITFICKFCLSRFFGFVYEEQMYASALNTLRDPQFHDLAIHIMQAADEALTMAIRLAVLTGRELEPGEMLPICAIGNLNRINSGFRAFNAL